MTIYTRRQVVQSAGAMGVGLLAGCGVPGLFSPRPSRLLQIGWLTTGSRELLVPPDPGVSDIPDGFIAGFRDLGYEEGRTHVLLWRQSDRGDERLREFAVELVNLPVDLLMVGGPSGQLAKDVTSTIPIVLVAGGDPVASGLVASYARPGGNITGVPSAPSGPFHSKLLELFREALKDLSSIAVLFDSSLPQPHLGPNGTLTLAARTLGLDLVPVGVRNVEELEHGFDVAARAGVAGIFVLQTALLNQSVQQVTTLGLRYALPSAGLYRNFAVAGGLLAYGPSLRTVGQRAAAYADRILKGTKPADLPVEQPMVFDFVINHQTAQTLGLTIPPHILLQATEVIQ
jgi:putative tryptophan/tyrosine transport system substrate-binding protein